MPLQLDMPSQLDITPPSAVVAPTSLPRGLRDRAAGMSWEALLAAHGPTVGPLRLGSWTSTAARGARSWLQHRNFKATLAIGDCTHDHTVAAAGPVAALTEMLYEHGYAVEMLEFHQRQAAEHTVTFVRGSNGVREQWAFGWDADPTRSTLRAVLACANRVCA